MAVKLTVMPRFIFKALWDPRVGDKDDLRDRVVATLTQGWEDSEIRRSLKPPMGPSVPPRPKEVAE